VMQIRLAQETDLEDVLSVERAAFGEDAEAELVRNLLCDASAEPSLSLLAFQDDRAVGHILFTAARLSGPSTPPKISILAPLAVVPDAQNRGIGGKLIERGLQRLSESGVDLVFVLGHPAYYPRHGFEPAGRLGLTAPYLIPEKDANAWMVQALREGVIGSVRGKVLCADALNRAEYWRE
jgi:putative acetyltransferase